MQTIDIFVMRSMAWLHNYLNWLRNDGYTIDSVVVFDGEVIIVQHRTITASDTVTRPDGDDKQCIEDCGR